MTKINLLIAIFLFSVTLANAQDCDCKTNYEWIKKTFEDNDAGFQYVLKVKGEQAYADHNDRISGKVQTANTLNECAPVLYEWLRFFRTGHLGLEPVNQQAQPQSTQADAQQSINLYSDWETLSVNTEDFKKYLDRKSIHDYEGIWETEPYRIGIKKEGDTYIGFIVESGADTWTKGQVKLKFSIAENEISSVFYMRDHSPVESDMVAMIGKNYLQIGSFNLSRVYPDVADELKYARYVKSLNSGLPYMEQLNQTTLYLRIPSFNPGFKNMIDSILNANKLNLLSTENLIIDIRDNGGGSDNAYSEIIPYLYTNPVRTVGVEYLSTKLNNQRMLDIINNPEYGASDSDKEWARESYQKLESKLGQFVNLNENMVSVYEQDTIHAFPKNVGIIINGGCGSTSEQFLLEARQSKKVKLFGVTTFGSLDISNMYFVESPCKEFQLGYALSRSMRIPDLTIDEIGIQPDYYIDRSIPLYDWTTYVTGIFNEQN